MTEPMLLVEEALDEEVPNRSVRNIDFFIRCKQN